jgi:hypothetical protein
MVDLRCTGRLRAAYRILAAESESSVAVSGNEAELEFLEDIAVAAPASDDATTD